MVFYKNTGTNCSDVSTNIILAGYLWKSAVLSQLMPFTPAEKSLDLICLILQSGVSLLTEHHADAWSTPAAGYIFIKLGRL